MVINLRSHLLDYESMLLYHTVTWWIFDVQEVVLNNQNTYRQD